MLPGTLKVPQPTPHDVIPARTYRHGLASEGQTRGPPFYKAITSIDLKTPRKCLFLQKKSRNADFLPPSPTQLSLDGSPPEIEKTSFILSCHFIYKLRSKW